jgi:hypothetical protein
VIVIATRAGTTTCSNTEVNGAAASHADQKSNCFVVVERGQAMNL